MIESPAQVRRYVECSMCGARRRLLPNGELPTGWQRIVSGRIERAVCAAHAAILRWVEGAGSESS